MDICTNILFLKILSYCMMALKIISFIVPITLIIKVGLDLYKNMINPSDKSDLKNNIIKRVVAAIIVFLTPTLVNLVMIFIETTTSFSSNYESCVANIENIEFYESQLKALEEKEEQLEKEKLLEKAKDLSAKQYEQLKKNLANINTSTSTNNSDSLHVGQKYDLSESELEDIAKICQQEQGSAVGAAAEASLMANRYELFYSDSSKYTSLYNYVLTSGWWNPAKTGSYKSTNLKSDVLNAVREVLVMGNRTLDLFVDEHDCIDCGSYGYDIKKIVNNGKEITDKTQLKNRSNYIKDITILYNKAGAVYTFSTFPTSTSDPFGYTKQAKDKYDSLNS